MSHLGARFESATRHVPHRPLRPVRETLLGLHAAFKQATLGDTSGACIHDESKESARQVDIALAGRLMTGR